MPNYGYIPIASVNPNDEVINSILVRLPKAIDGKWPTAYDTDGLLIPNVLELEHSEFSEAHKTRIAELAGQWFATADDYLTWMAYIQQNPEPQP